MQRKDKSFVLALVSLLTWALLSSCAKIHIKNDPWCADAGRFGCEGFYTVSDDSFTWDRYEWDRRRVGQICSASDNPGESFKNLRVALLKACADNNRCSKEEKNAILKAAKKIQRALGKSSVQLSLEENINE